MPTPYTGPTSRQFRPELGEPVADAQVVPLDTYGIVSTVPHVVYIVQEGDTLAGVARTLYGANTPANRARVRHTGFHVGAIHHVPLSTLTPKDTE